VRAVATRALAGARRLLQDDWIAVSAIDFDGTPLGDVPYRLTLADGLVKLGFTDELGRLTERGAPRGHFTIDLNEAAP
jgi:hypothetical protein